MFSLSMLVLGVLSFEVPLESGSYLSLGFDEKGKTFLYNHWLALVCLCVCVGVSLSLLKL